MREPRHGVLRRHHRQVAEGVGVAGWSEFPGIDALHQIETALHKVPTAGAAAVVTGVEAAVRVELEAEGVAAALRENFVGAGARMVPPDHAAFEMHARRIRGIETGTRDPARGGAPLRAVEPAVRSPNQAVRDGVGVLEPEAGQPCFRRAVGDVVAVGVGIEEQVRGVHDPHAAVAAQGGVGHIEAVGEYLVTVKSAVAPG